MQSLLRGSVLALIVLIVTSALSFAEQAAPDKPADKPDPYAVPEGTTQDYVDFLQKLAKVKPTNAEEAEKMRAALLEASDKILAAKPDEKQLALAVSAKYQALGDSLDKLAQFADELEKDGHARLARDVRGFALARKLQLKPLSKETIKDRATEIVDFLSKAPVDAGMDAQLAKMAGRMAELSGDGQFAADIYRKLQEIFSGSSDPAAARIGKAMEGIVRRMSLVGNSMTIEGTVLGGGPFDWSKYQGRVVLVNFFATWCGPCRKEIENITRCYDLYHDKGFDVVAISCDRNQTSLEQFIADKKLPWSVVYGDKKPSPTVAYYGVDGIPQLILIGKDGKVITLNARGDVLPKELEKLLGPAEEKKASGSGA